MKEHDWYGESVNVCEDYIETVNYIIVNQSKRHTRGGIYFLCSIILYHYKAKHIEAQTFSPPFYSL